MEKQFIELRDKIEIQELNAKYAWAVDSNAITDYLDTWHPDGISEAPFGNAEGHNELAQRFEETQRGLSKNKRHLVSNLVIHLDGDKASQQCYLTVVEHVESAKVVATAIF